jgi:hypothetical protein
MGWIGWMHGVTSVTAACYWLAATSSYDIKGTVGWRREKVNNERGKPLEEQKEGTYCRLIASLFY